MSEIIHPVYKVNQVIGGKYYSAWSLPPDWIVQYIPGERIYGRRGTPVLGFSLLENAKSFASLGRIMMPEKTFAIWSGTAEVVMPAKQMVPNVQRLPNLTNSIVIRMWHSIMSGRTFLPAPDHTWEHRAPYAVPPRGTVMCKWIKLDALVI